MQKYHFGLGSHISYKCFTLDYDFMYITNVLHWIMISCILQMFYTGLESHISYKGFTLDYDLMSLTMFYFEL